MHIVSILFVLYACGGSGSSSSDITITGGGAGLWAKTEVSSTDSSTWYPNTYLENFEFYNLDISNTYNEAMYIGPTATYWNIQTNAPYYPSSPTDTTASSNPTVYKQPIKLRNVNIHDNNVHDIGNDGIQTAIDNLEVYDNEVANWATKHGAADNGGILIGGHVKGFNVHDNYVHDSWGEMMQVYAEGGATSVINSNLLVDNQQDGVSMRGTKRPYRHLHAQHRGVGRPVVHARERLLRPDLSAALQQQPLRPARERNICLHRKRWIGNRRNISE
jgi:hypothetical protein